MLYIGHAETVCPFFAFIVDTDGYTGDLEALHFFLDTRANGLKIGRKNKISLYDSRSSCESVFINLFNSFSHLDISLKIV